jgi:hypothetical protein
MLRANSGRLLRIIILMIKLLTIFCLMAVFSVHANIIDLNHFEVPILTLSKLKEFEFSDSSLTDEPTLEHAVTNFRLKATPHMTLNSVTYEMLVIMADQDISLQLEALLSNGTKE